MKRSLLLFPLAAACALPLSAQSPAPEGALTLADCLALAERAHPTLAAARAGVEAARAAEGEARAPLYPSVDLNAGYHRWQRRAFLPSGLALPGGRIPELIGPLDDWNGGVSSRVLLFDAGERRAAMAAAAARRAGAEAEVEAADADLQLAVRTAFYSLAAALDLQEVAAQNLARSESHVGLAEARRAAGAAPPADVLRLEADRAAAELQVIATRSAVRIATGRLNTALGRAPGEPLAIAPAADSPAPAPADLAAAIDTALARRPELAAGERRAAAARAGVEAARAARAPKLRADAAFGWRDTGWLPGTEEWQGGLSVELPVFDGGVRARRLARSRAELAREEAALESRRLQVRQEVWTAAAELERAGAAIAAHEAAVRAGAESLRLTQERYRHGAAIATDLLDTQTALARAEAALAAARWDFLAARAVFDRAVGAP